MSGITFELMLCDKLQVFFNEQLHHLIYKNIKD